MTSVAPVVSRPEANFFQQYLIPEDAKWVRYAMLKAGEFSVRSSPLLSHVASTACVVAAVVLSTFNAFSYLLQIPLSLPLKLVQFDLVGFVQSPIANLISAVQSVVMFSLGPTLVTVGLLFPKELFTHFAPEHYLSLEQRLQQENESLKRSTLRKDAEIDGLTESLTIAATKIEELKQEVHKRKHPIRKLLPRIC
jgi:hypothetical protein